MRGRTFAACFIASLTTGCASTAGKITVLTSDPAGLAPGSTYVWASPPADARPDPRVARVIVEQRLHTAVDQALAARGYRRVTAPEDAALQVAYHAVLQDLQDTSITGFSLAGGTTCGVRGCRDGWGLYGPPRGGMNLAAYAKGTLILDVTDARTGRLAWRATSDKRVDHADATQAGLNSIAAELTRALPGP
ncbi:DUF4136 domain-containing protein [Brevundimonas goettingensis]|uniref:DUF4136 domain-containing protein n=1 Tax=Brevundimonas goettingensis TaxID=2774190 RepID=A0A975C1N3_9CAUL|nr:DUF4136 domain-containing protein [Brevundimonas goettingensis]QTC92253.1 DUF4136 domain-containing protein [Brevundimonas goettingensis]